jgi:hypothetical protein
MMGSLMNWKGFGRKQSGLRYYPSSHLEGLRKIAEHVRVAGILS